MRQTRRLGRVLGVSRALVAALVIAAAAGCAPFVAETDPDTEVIRAGDVFVIAETEEYTGDVAGQGITVRLELVDGCVGSQLGDAGVQDDGVVILFPPGTKVTGTDDDLVIEVRGDEYRLGDLMEGGTRLSEDAHDPLTSFGNLAEQAPDSCRDRDATPVDPDG